MKKLSADEIQNRFAKISNWKLEGDEIKKEFQFSDFKEAMGFINKVGELAELHNHHPELWNVYNKVTVTYTTHDANGLTEKDFLLAELIDQLTASN